MKERILKISLFGITLENNPFVFQFRALQRTMNRMKPILILKNIMVT